MALTRCITSSPIAQTLAVEPFQSDERPAFRYRHIWMVKDPVLQDAWRLGGWHVTSGHALERLVPAKVYAAAHPDYYGPGHHQPCLTHPEVLAIVVKHCREELDRKPGVLSFSLSANDNKVYCECARCQAVGNISARMLNFANNVARELAKTHPHRYLLTFLAYWLAHDTPAPMLKAEPGVCVMQVNEGNRLRSWERLEPKKFQTLERNDNNYREVTAFAGWRQTGAIMAIYEWWIPGCKQPEWQRVPWYSGETALQNLRYWKRNDVKYITYESGYERGDGFPIRWPLYYVGARGLWNPELTSKQIMSEACAKLYGPAAQPMLRFYETIEQATTEVPPTLRGFAWHLPSPASIYLPPIEARATAALDEASSIKVGADIQARHCAGTRHVGECAHRPGQSPRRQEGQRSGQRFLQMNSALIKLSKPSPAVIGRLIAAAALLACASPSNAAELRSDSERYVQRCAPSPTPSSSMDGTPTASSTTPLFVDGLQAETLEPVRWKKGGQTWVLCNFASQQALLRTLDGLSALTQGPLLPPGGGGRHPVCAGAFALDQRLAVLGRAHGLGPPPRPRRGPVCRCPRAEEPSALLLSVLARGCARHAAIARSHLGEPCPGLVAAGL